MLRAVARHSGDQADANTKTEIGTKRRAAVSSAIEEIVAAYVQLGQLDALHDLKAHREKLAASIRDRLDFDFGVLLGQLDDDLHEIDAGIRRLRMER
ncbi:MAG: hypothetical protein JWR89_1294 [Tardiphaga sp.]|uniref:hypothetical protein n=1 Tax=Tardiphaga sp. TaxID=1926292 RepID=UPI00261BA110|nr:hypothetical protein [Tardiphaga sp.]MDB5501392.1 hypothetical protein [Tardiphaga sp.]